MPLPMEPRKKETMNASRFQARTAKKTTETTVDVVDPTVDIAISVKDFSVDSDVLTATGTDDSS
jgi:hypothetical protein